MNAILEATKHMTKAVERQSNGWQSTKITLHGVNLDVFYTYNEGFEGDGRWTAPTKPYYDIHRVELLGCDVTRLVEDKIDEIEEAISKL